MMRFTAMVFVALMSAASGLQTPTTTKAAPKSPSMRPATIPKSWGAAGAAMAAASANVQVALAGGQSEGTGLILGVDDGRQLVVSAVIFAAFWTLYFGWAKDQPDNGSDFFGEYDERRL
mmetsp:Transcript_2882/g.9564  ORF Transcript_2882/g.9564 Transcript_2882/m.9564 type:complete len:119 (+) Transcript_2882:260-616(+)